MHRRFLRTVAAGSAVAASIAAVAAQPAGAVPPPSAPTAFVRVEGAGATLLPETLVHTHFGTSVRRHTCSQTSVAGALDAATNGQWTGAFSAAQHDYFLSSILGETPSGNNYWTLFVNGRASSAGACSTPAHADDHVLWFDCQADAQFNCTNNPLALTAPAIVKRGQNTTVHVAQIDGNGHSTPETDAAVGGKGVAGVSSGGTATIRPQSTGVITLQATKTGATPSDPLFMCVYVHSRGECGHAGAGPAVRVTGVKNHEVFRRARAPRELKGTAGPDPSGLTDVSFSLTRTTSKTRCSYYDADRGRFVSRSCFVHTPVPSFSLGASSVWSYLLPAGLTPGRYVLIVRATDRADRTGESVIDFTVR